MRFEQIRDMEPFNSDRWLYAAVRSVNQENFSFIFVVLEALKLRTPHSIMRLFPPTKEFDGERFGCKDYFYTMEALKDFDLDCPLGDRVMDFLRKYVNPHLNELVVNYWCCHINHLPRRAMAVMKAYMLKTPVLSMDSLCEDCTDSESMIVLHIVSSATERFYKVGQDTAIDQGTFLRAKPELRQFIGDERLDVCERMLMSHADTRRYMLEVDFLSALLPRKRVRALTGDMADMVRKARRPYGLLGRALQHAGVDLVEQRLSDLGVA